MKFVSGANIFEFADPADYPASRPIRKMQALDRAASGRPEVERLGPDNSGRVLDFSAMPEIDYLGYNNWFVSIADGAVNSFEFHDEKGFVGNVIITSLVSDLREIAYQLYAGSIVLEYV